MYLFHIFILSLKKEKITVVTKTLVKNLTLSLAFYLH